jgi:hypothetical protein
VAAGLKEQGFPAKQCRRWDRQKVLAAIQARERQGLRLASVYQDDMGLYIQARKYFGSWQQAVLAAAREPQKEETKAKKKSSQRK